MPHPLQPRRSQQEQPVDTATARALADEQLLEADEIVRELIPEAHQVVLADPDEPYEPGALQLRHVLDAYGAVLYTAGEHDALADLIETHLIDARDATPDSRPAHIISTETATESSENTPREWSSPADVLHTTYGHSRSVPRPGSVSCSVPYERGRMPHAHTPNTRHHLGIDLG